MLYVLAKPKANSVERVIYLSSLLFFFRQNRIHDQQYAPVIPLGVPKVNGLNFTGTGMIFFVHLFFGVAELVTKTCFVSVLMS
jgi:hypothetical protein